MKLSKEVCKRCNKRARADWDEVDDHEWECGFVWCPIQFVNHSVGHCRINIWRGIDHSPPSWCPFAVEHIALYAASQEEAP